MIVQLHGVAFINKGAELMLRAIVLQMAQQYGYATVAMKTRNGTRSQRKQAGVQDLLSWDFKRAPAFGPLVDRGTHLIPPSIRKHYRWTLASEVAAVLDASGFAYSDQWGPTKTEYAARMAQTWKAKGRKIVLLPQAFGPFNNHRLRMAMQQYLEYSDLVFARDEVSYRHLQELNVSGANIHMAPDFTNLIPGRLPPYADQWRGRPVIVPNKRMLDRTTGDVNASYLPFLQICIRHLLDRGQEPYLLVHDTESDQALAKEIQSESPHPIPILNEADPLYIKGLLGCANLVISSRYHGLISALSQAIPALGTGWSHKYRLLFKSYDCVDCLVALTSDEATISHMIDQLLNEPTRRCLIGRLQQASARQKEQSVQMWEMVHQVLTT